MCDGKAPPRWTINPVHTGTGSKYWKEVDYASVNVGGLHFSHSYSSQNTIVNGTMGIARRHHYDRLIVAGLTVNGVSATMAARPDGTSYAFTGTGPAMVSQDADVTDKLTRLTDGGGNPTGWTYLVAADNSLETYDAAGKLVSIKDRAGVIQTLTYSDASTPVSIAPSAGLLIRVTDSFSRQLNFRYDSSKRITKLIDPASREYVYAYDAVGNLQSVTYPDLVAPKTRTYLYNESSYTGGTNLPNALTGIVDENGVRYASYWYDAQGRAYKEELAGGVSQYQISYNATSSTITDPRGTARTTNFTTILGVIKATGQSQPGGAGCGAASSAVTYDANGNVSSATDFNNNKTCYAYDTTRNLETARIEGLPGDAVCSTVLSATSLTLPARKISTAWHATYRLPVSIAEPKRITSFDLDPATGNLLTKTVKATNDATGVQGAGAAVVGTPRVWSYTYNGVGQVLTAKSPRTDVNDTTTYVYDPATGNLQTVTNSAGHVTSLSNYDPNGRVGQIVDANGLTTALEYYPRGWLKTKTVTGNGVSELTSYDYDGVGQLKKVTLPDTSWVGYTYDDAHRLTDIADSAGNTIHYVLDAMGNRTNEQIKDPSGALSRQVSRIYDALNRLQFVTGATQ